MNRLMSLLMSMDFGQFKTVTDVDGWSIEIEELKTIYTLD